MRPNGLNSASGFKSALVFTSGHGSPFSRAGFARMISEGLAKIASRATLCSGLALRLFQTHRRACINPCIALRRLSLSKFYDFKSPARLGMQ
jgi:hypothetical protein